MAFGRGIPENNGKTHYLWRAVDQQGNLLDILVQSRRNKAAAKRFFSKLLTAYRYIPRVLITEKLGSYATAKQAVLPSAEHRQHRRLNNRAESSDQPTRQRERGCPLGGAPIQISGPGPDVDVLRAVRYLPDHPYAHQIHPSIQGTLSYSSDADCPEVSH
jgi:putative transposase